MKEEQLLLNQGWRPRGLVCFSSNSHSRVAYEAVPLRDTLGLYEIQFENHHGRLLSWRAKSSNILLFFLVAYIIWIILCPSLCCVDRVEQLI